MGRLFENSRIYSSEEMDKERISAIDSEERIRILKELSKNPSYPAEIAKKLGTGRQKTYYHFRKLEEAGVIEEVEKRDLSGGTASIYRPAQESLHLVTGKGREWKTGINEEKSRKFLHPLVNGNSLDGSIVVGSPDQHGPDQVRARDGHLAGEVGMVLGRYTYVENRKTVFDTDLTREEFFRDNLLMIGGVLTNTVTKKFNENFPVEFTGENFPYRRIETPEGEEIDDPNTGVIQRAENPFDSSKKIFMVAGVRNKGTEAAVAAFRDLENVIESEGMRDYYIVKGLDMDGDGVVDDYELL